MKKEFTTITLLFLFVFIELFFVGIAFGDQSVYDQNRNSGNNNRSVSNQNQESLSENMKSTVLSILSNYDADNLTEADAKAINNAFREAGIRQGAGQQEAIESAGFSPRKISSLDPPPSRNEGRRPAMNREE